MSSSPLPSLQALLASPDTLASFLSLLLETTPSSTARLTADLQACYSHPGRAPPATHAEVLHVGEELVDAWEGWDGKVGFVEGHPRIGEGDVLSDLSRREQAGGPPTTQATLDRLKQLNAAYEQAFPKLRYITFVAGRSRAAIVPELESIVYPARADAEREEGVRVREEGSEEWTVECQRAVRDVWRIAHARLGSLLAAAGAND